MICQKERLRVDRLLVCLFLVALLPWTSCDLELTILHNNDVHARFLPVTEQSSFCIPEKQVCMAGAARTVHMVEKIRSRRNNTVLFISAGDFYQGSIWYSEYKYKIVNDFVFKMGYDIMTLGNHEFDDGVEGLLPFLKAAQNNSVPIVCTNLDISNEPRVQGLIASSVVKQYSGRSVAFVGYVIPTTAYLSNPGPTILFNPEIEAIKKEVANLKDEGIEIIIAIGHSGFKTDLDIAQQIPDIDIVVGGHSNTFLWPGTKDANAVEPSIEKAVSPYPTVVDHGDKKSLVVQAYAFAKYLGVLDVTFDDEGNIKSYQGQPILMSSDVSQKTSSDLKGLSEKYMNERPDLFRVVGTTYVLLEGREVKCRMRECLLGNMIADAYVYNFLDTKANDKLWTNYPIALVPGGGIRTSIDVLSRNGLVTFADVKNVCPFGNKVIATLISGKDLYDIFEHSVSTWDANMRQLEGRFLQVSGIRVVYDTTKQPGNRVVSIQARCRRCTSPQYRPVNLDANYTIIITEYMKKGGDGYLMLRDKPLLQSPDVNDTGSLVQYFNDHKIVLAELQDRVVFKQMKSSSNNRLTSHRSLLVLISLAMLLSATWRDF